MIKRLNNSKGITLIALVITIIVLLILAGIAISMLSGDDGILKQAAEAKVKTEEQAAIEKMKLGAMEALASAENNSHSIPSKDDLEKALKSQGLDNAEVTEVDGGYQVTANGVIQVITNSGKVREQTGVEKNTGKVLTEGKTILVDSNNEQIVIPEGFKIKEDSPTTVKRGIVVVAPDNSEFVWVPVKNINSMVMCQAHTGTSNCNIVKGADGKLTCENHADTKICGKLYNTTARGNFDSKITTQTYNENSILREPLYLSNTTQGDAVTGDSTKGIELLKSKIGLTGTDEEILSKWETELQTEFEKMAKYVYENKGFYVGRYETSLNATTNYAQSKSGVSSVRASSSSANTWYGLYKVEKEYSTNEYEAGKTLDNVVGSSMIWGSQYDQMMIWMQNNGIDVNSTNPINLEGTKTSKNTSSVAGSKAEDKLNNIYDLLGNGYEWTLEGYKNFCRIFRGSAKGASSVAASFCDIDYPHSANSTCSSRIALYVK